MADAGSEDADEQLILGGFTKLDRLKIPGNLRSILWWRGDDCFGRDGIRRHDFRVGGS